MKRCFICCLFLCLLLIGCGRDLSLNEGGVLSKGDDLTLSAEVGKSFEIAVGQEVFTPELRIIFERVTIDGRCEWGLVCVQDGWAEILLRTYDASNAMGRLELTIPGNVPLPYSGDNAVEHGDLRIRLLRLDPYPLPGLVVQQDEYRALLVVE